MQNRTNLYVDGFNLYYGCIKDTPYRWLNLAELFHHIFPHLFLHRIRYFTALIRPTPSDPQKLQRQLTYLRALQTLPNLSIHYGDFLSRPRHMPLLDENGEASQLVRVMYTEEKGSDVNLATYLLVDGYESDYDIAIVISNDSDLVEPVRIVTERLHLRVGILNPHNRPSYELRQVATFYRKIRRSALAASQFPPVLYDEDGTIIKPKEW